jgi:hypothetical protein
MSPHGAARGSPVLGIVVVCLAGTVAAHAVPPQAADRSPAQTVPCAARDLIGAFRFDTTAEPSLRISRDGARCMWSLRQRDGQWTAPTAAEPVLVAPEEVARLEREGIRNVSEAINVGRGSADQRATVMRVPVGWQYREFRSATGYVLFGWFGPQDIYKVP